MFRQTKKRISSRRNFGSAEEGSNDSLTASSRPEQEQRQLERLYTGKLSFYHERPLGEITLEHFETWAIDRLKVLLEIEAFVSRNYSLKEMESLMKPLLHKLLPLGTDNVADMRKDYISHYILRLCFCRKKELRDKFVRSETLLFKIRFGMLTSTDQVKFVQSLHLSTSQSITEEEKRTLSKELYQTISPLLQFQMNISDEQQKQAYFQQERFIKLPFENVIELLGNRQVFIKNGYAYLPHFQQVTMISSEFSQRLNDELMRTFQFLPRLNEDDRLVPILNHLSSGYTVSDYNNSKGANGYGNNDDDEINAESVWSPEISKHYPLSVRNLMQGLKQNHHLRYYGRQQLTLFLKGIGLSADESLKFWTKAFVQGGHISEDKFNKEYRYNFRHSYGLEGNRINYRPWDCRTILSKPRPGRGDYHGCPFRDWSSERLTSELQAMNLTQQQITSVLDLSEKGDYILANTKVFEFTHKGADVAEGTLIDHPNLYFERSRMLEKKRSAMGGK
ncbi:DNA primase subunit PRI2 KNAG_0A07170 [Huiozyma naganishii CBS 8797]|uniref:DNA primase large subunit n=1 Tax=Huiozyma naganishii (strain ATCC MYA-139 / BCRC 22969 / CBS 8797 / KCTC 17520 / NBRC 10181 / NCYC 3082 / Yp74L-3) TaxID=1071383 RepID=J7R0M9_HUIN7|nr:hypothetical protein KNAG_0A07170 [Kazachstania naganishii CBS 8797]CCK68370.1 hypothetical protein KNAG_0A07170 [Kazachstania naganishii CBS 8797]